MSETPETPVTETETLSAEAAEAEAAAQAAPRTPQVGLQSLLTKASDVAARPGFRSPANQKSKAQKGGRRKK
jgi:hypothetical protein